MRYYTYADEDRRSEAAPPTLRRMTAVPYAKLPLMVMNIWHPIARIRLGVCALLKDRSIMTPLKMR